MTAMRSNTYWNLAMLMLLICCIFMSACSSGSQLGGDQYLAPANATNQPNYSNLYYWAAHPYKYDPSDSTPKPYRDFDKDTSVDVFFIYPTSYTNEDMVDASALDNPAELLKWNASVNDAGLNEKTDKTSILSQASAFNKYRVFAPRYRQAHYQSFFIPDSIAAIFFDTAYADVAAAFDYYLQHFNNGRPFIIASHSQGTVHAGRLIKEKIENKPLQNQLVAAYLLGMPVPTDYFSGCVPCAQPAQTNCFVSWRTIKKGYTPEIVKNENYDVVVVNPLNWRMDSLVVAKENNKGAVLFNFNKPRNHAVSAQVHHHFLWSSKPHFWGSIFFVKKDYHIGDINLFWKNIRENLDVRVAAFKNDRPDIGLK